MERAGKVWGETSTIFKSNNVEVHYITVKAGGFCSIHLHSHKYNRFSILNGTLVVKIWKDYGSSQLVDTTTLNAGDEMTVAPGEKHQFNALTDVSAIETYWVELDSSDIERDTHGGLQE